MADAQGKFIEAEPQFDDLPRGWATAAIGQVVEVRRLVQPKDHFTGEFPYIDLGVVDNERHEVGEPSITLVSAAPSRARKLVRTNDILFSCVRVYLENIAIVPKRLDGAIASTAYAVLTPTTALLPRYLFHFLTWRRTVQELSALQKGNSPPSMSDSDLLDHKLPLPPHAEQRRIVSRIDELFSRIEAGERAIAAARAGLKRYRKSILKAAVTGALTADWREERSRPDSALSERPNEAPEDFDAPPGWTWFRVGQLQSLITSGSRGWGKYYSETGTVFVRAQNINTGALHLDDVAYVSLPENAEGLRTRIHTGDILVTITGANVTVSARVERDIGEAYVNQHVAIVRTQDRDVAPYLHLWLRAPGAGLTQLERAAYGAGKPGLSLQNIREVWVCLPPSDERTEIVSRVEAALSRAEHAGTTLNAQARHARALKQSILKAAFEGGLVQQDPNDEPAADMLARIASDTSAPKIKTKARA